MACRGQILPKQALCQRVGIDRGTGRGRICQQGAMMLDRFRDYWVYGGSLAGVILLIVGVGIAPFFGMPLLLIYLLLPIYMLHQLEEHYDDRFRTFVNREVGGGAEVLTRGAVFLINVPGVWGIYAIVFALAATVHIGFGLIAAYTTLVNALAHAGQALQMRRANPGIYTAMLLFLPASILTIQALAGIKDVGAAFHGLGLVVALTIHALIIGYVAVRRTATL
ncbi:HXXEE domain-containing protein [Pelagibacterium sp. H642]|uniref:HXXEE domain-containing protein n=1 Tax=Pelagibacterium sp. H642 TaxID=1881069 RepID=UPI0028163A8D|nr:HXXEE domain-containing protein [Pelagibacterium sp. H642]WMT92634.1 HXXEE domain-containing protein [Pelagibacterium sp. H642]